MIFAYFCRDSKNELCASNSDSFALRMRLLCPEGVVVIVSEVVIIDCVGEEGVFAASKASKNDSCPPVMLR